MQQRDARVFNSILKEVNLTVTEPWEREWPSVLLPNLGPVPGSRARVPGLRCKPTCDSNVDVVRFNHLPTFSAQ